MVGRMLCLALAAVAMSVASGCSGEADTVEPSAAAAPQPNGETAKPRNDAILVDPGGYSAPSFDPCNPYQPWLHPGGDNICHRINRSPNVADR